MTCTFPPAPNVRANCSRSWAIGVFIARARIEVPGARVKHRNATMEDGGPKMAKSYLHLPFSIFQFGRFVTAAHPENPMDPRRKPAACGCAGRREGPGTGSSIRSADRDETHQPEGNRS